MTRRRARGDGNAERGSATVEWAIGALVLVSLLALTGHAVRWGLASLAARQAATHALHTTRVLGGSETAGHADAVALLDQLAGGGFTDQTVTVTRTATTTTVSITGQVPTLIPGLTLPVDATLAAPTERYTLP